VIPIRRFPVFCSFALSTTRIVFGFLGQSVFVKCPFTLAGGVKYLAHVDVRPNFDPRRSQIAIQRCAVFVNGCNAILLLEVAFSKVEVGQRTFGIRFEIAMVSVAAGILGNCRCQGKLNRQYYEQVSWHGNMIRRYRPRISTWVRCEVCRRSWFDGVTLG
jgi:hypothetical protein